MKDLIKRAAKDLIDSKYAIALTGAEYFPNQSGFGYFTPDKKVPQEYMDQTKFRDNDGKQKFVPVFQAARTRPFSL